MKDTFAELYAVGGQLMRFIHLYAVGERLSMNGVRHHKKCTIKM